MAGQVPGVPPVAASPPDPPATAPAPGWFSPLPPDPLPEPLLPPVPPAPLVVLVLPVPPAPAAVDVVEVVVVAAGAVDVVVVGTCAADTGGDDVLDPPD